jgi:transcriptional regulator NrdR family protein
MKKNIVCPKCGSMNNAVYSVRKYEDRIIRYRACGDCKHKFKSIEKTLSGWDYEDAMMKIKKIVDRF